MMFLTPGTSLTPRCTECEVIFCVRSTLTRAAPGIAATASRTSFFSASCWLFAG